MKNKLKITLIIFILIFSCGSSSHAEDVDIAVLLKGMSNPYWKTLYDGVIAKSKELGVNVYVQGIQKDSEAEEQLNLCNTMLLRKPKALIFAAVNKVNLASCLVKASQKEIKLIGVDGGMGEEDAKRMKIKVAFSVASNNYNLGKNAAEYLTGVMGEVLLIEGFPGSSAGELRKQGFKENISQDLRIIASLPGNWDRIRAADITNTIITKHPELVAIFAANDLMALGASEALLARNIKRVKVIGVDGIVDAIKAIKSDRLTASIAQLPYLMGMEAIEKTYKLINGEETYTFNQEVPVVTLDKTTLTKNTEPLLEYVR